jgi:hypothetical protein
MIKIKIFKEGYHIKPQIKCIVKYQLKIPKIWTQETKITTSIMLKNMNKLNKPLEVVVIQRQLIAREIQILYLWMIYFKSIRCKTNSQDHILISKTKATIHILMVTLLLLTIMISNIKIAWHMNSIYKTLLIQIIAI